MVHLKLAFIYGKAICVEIPLTTIMRIITQPMDLYWVYSTSLHKWLAILAFIDTLNNANFAWRFAILGVLSVNECRLGGLHYLALWA